MISNRLIKSWKIWFGINFEIESIKISIHWIKSCKMQSLQLKFYYN